MTETDSYGPSTPTWKASTPPVEKAMQSVLDTARLCESLASLRSIVLILNISLTEILVIYDPKERNNEIEQYERRLRRCLTRFATSGRILRG